MLQVSKSGEASALRERGWFCQSSILAGRRAHKCSSCLRASLGDAQCSPSSVPRWCLQMLSLLVLVLLARTATHTPAALFLAPRCLATHGMLPGVAWTRSADPGSLEGLHGG